jgi:protein TonB
MRYFRDNLHSMTLEKAMISSSMFLLAGFLAPAGTAQDAAKTQAPAPAEQSSHPACLDCPFPDYPSGASKARTESPAVVVLVVVVTEKGDVRDARVLESPGKDFTDKAMKAIKKWKLRPATKDGKPVMTRVTIQVVFHPPD